MDGKRFKHLSAVLSYKVDLGCDPYYIVIPAYMLEKLTDEEELKLRKELKKLFDNWDNIESNPPW